MDWQWIANGAFIVIGIVGTALFQSLKESTEHAFKSVNESIHEIELDTVRITDKVQAIELLVAGNYVRKDELRSMTDALFKKLDQICDKIDRKVDK
jgi:hypothetical protein